MNYTVFVYGTLMKNRSNHRFMKDHYFRYDALIYDYGLKLADHYPVAVKMKGYKIYGEVYEVDEKTKANLDILHEAGKLFDCKLVTVYGLADMQPKEVLFYEYLGDTDKMETFTSEEKWFLR